MYKALLSTAIVLTFAVSARAGGVARSDNFIILADSQPLADMVLAEAEMLRDNLAVECLGRRLPTGKGRTTITVRLDETRDDALFWPKDHPDRRFHRMWLFTGVRRVVGSTFRHEMTHLVLEIACGQDLPIWADEGLACLEDDVERTARRRALIHAMAAEGRLPDARGLLEADRIASTDRTAYAAAASLTRFLLAHGDKPTLVSFAVAGRREGWNLALREHYGVTSVDQLQAAWQAWVRGER